MMRVLVIQLKRIGDLLLTTPLLSVLREQVPGIHLTLAIDAATSPLAPAIDADRVLVFQRGLAGLSFWRAIAAERFDLALDVTGNDRSALVAALSKARKRVTWQRFQKRPFRKLVYTDFVDSSVRDRHTADHHTDLLRALDIHVEGVPTELRLPANAVEEAASVLKDLPPRFAVVHPGTARAEKFWLPERWSEVIRFLEEEMGLPVVVTGSNAPMEREHLAAIAAHRPIRSLAGKLSLLGTAALIQRATVVCSVDSAPVHLADALGTPVVALFGPTNPFHWRPRRSRSIVVRSAGAGPIRPKDPGSPMSEISTDLVRDAVKQLLSRNR